MPVDLLADAREWLAAQGDRVQTHSDKCHLWHPACLVARLVREVERHREAVRRLAEQDATLSVCDGSVTVTMDATLTDEEYLALAQARDAYAANSDDEECVEIATVIRSLLERNSPDRIGKPLKNGE